MYLLFNYFVMLTINAAIDVAIKGFEGMTCPIPLPAPLQKSELQ